MTKHKETVAVRVVEQILDVRGQKVILDADLARIYGVETRTLNQAVKRNPERFPSDFAFRLSLEDAEDLRRSRSQSVTLKRGQNVKYRPWVFTEHGAIMAASVLNSSRAVELSVFVVRAFVRLRDFARGNVELAARLRQLERRVGGHDQELAEILAAIRQLTAPVERPRRTIGFTQGRGR